MMNMGEFEHAAKRVFNKAKELLKGPAVDEDASTVYPVSKTQTEELPTEVPLGWFQPTPQPMDARTRRTEAAILRFIKSPENHFPEEYFIVPVDGTGPMPMDPLDGDETEISFTYTRRRGKGRILATLGQLETAAA